MGLLGGGSSKSTTKESGSSTTNTTNSAGTSTGNNALAGLIGNLQSQIASAGEGYSKDNAIADSQTAADAAMQKVLRTGVGTVNASTTSGGAYNSTTQKLLSDNLAAEGAAASAEVTQNTISNYAQISNAQSQLALQSMLSALGLDQSSSSSSNQQTDYSKTTTTTTPKSGGLGGLLSTGLTIAGGVVGGIYGGPLGASIGASLGSAVGGAVSGNDSGNTASGITGKQFAGS